MPAIRCETSTVRCLPALLLKEQQGWPQIFQDEHTCICLRTASFNYAGNTACTQAAEVPGVSPLRGGPCDGVHHSWDTCRLEWRETFADPGQWSVGQTGLPVCLCTSAHRCCQRARQHVDSSAGPFPSDLSTHEQKYELQLTSGKASARRASERLKGGSLKMQETKSGFHLIVVKMLHIPHFIACIIM